ncbi:MAG: ATP-dependent zinc protease [Microbacteriaceae bacterium]
MAKPSHSNTIAGWREWIALPDAGVPWIKAKIDTGARTSSLHAFDIDDAGDTVSFWVHPWQDSTEDARRVELAVHDRRVIRSSSGHEEERIVVLTAVTLVGRVINAELTLTNRDSMGFRMLIGREALQQGFVVDPAASFLGGRAPRHVRLANRAR